MRKLAMVMGISFLTAACGGGEPAQDAATPAADQPAPAAATASHDVNMMLEGTTYMFMPATLSVRAGDQVVFHNVSGGPHNVQFWPDSIPAGAAGPLGAGMPEQMSPLAGPLVIEPNGTYTVSFAGAPAGDYRFFCLPHLANNMVGVITVTP